MHPIRHKTNFGEKAGRIAVKFYNGTAVVTGYIAKQTGARRYKVTADGVNFFICTLAQTASQVTALLSGTGTDAALRPTLCTIEITPFGGSVEHVRVMHSKKLLTVEGSHLQWGLNLVASTATQGTIAVSADSAPAVTNPIPNETATVAAAWTYTVPANTFHDFNNDTLTYTATVSPSTPLPAWLSFDGQSRTFTKAAGAGVVGTTVIRVTANDGTLTGYDEFNLVLS